jgi:hypothetical protein
MSRRWLQRTRAGGAVRLSCLIVAGAAATGCTTKPFLSSGDANSAAVGFAGGNLAAATAVAEDHCARYERVARLLETQEDVAYFECHRP